MLVFHKVLKGADDSIVKFHAFEPTHQSLFKLAAWKLEIWRDKSESAFDQPFILNGSIGSIVSTINSEARISCIITIV